MASLWELPVAIRNGRYVPEVRTQTFQKKKNKK